MGSLLLMPRRVQVLTAPGTGETTLIAALWKPPSDSNQMILRCAAIWQASMCEERTNQVPKSSASTRDTRPLTTTGDVLWSCWVIADDRPALNGLPRCLRDYFGLHFPVVSSFTSPALHGWSAKAGSVHAASTPPRTVTARSLRMLDPPSILRCATVPIATTPAHLIRFQRSEGLLRAVTLIQADVAVAANLRPTYMGEPGKRFQ